MKKQNTSEIVLIAAAAGAAAAGAVIAIYEVLKSEKGQAGIAKAKAGVVNTAGKVKNGVVNTAGKIKSKLPSKAPAADECDCDLGLEDEVIEPVEA